MCSLGHAPRAESEDSDPPPWIAGSTGSVSVQPEKQRGGREGGVEEARREEGGGSRCKHATVDVAVLDVTTGEATPARLGGEPAHVSSRRVTRNSYIMNGHDIRWIGSDRSAERRGAAAAVIWFTSILPT